MNITQKKQTEVINMIKARAFNRIRHIHSKHFKYSSWSDIHCEPYVEQRDYAVKEALRQMEEDIKKYKAKIERYKQSIQH